MKNIEEILDSVKEYQIFAQRMFLILAIFINLIGLVAWKSFLIVAGIIMVCACLYATFSFCLIEQPKALKQFWICYWTLMISACTVMNSLLIRGFDKFPKILLLLLDTVIICLFIVFRISGDEDQKEAKKIQINKIITKDIYATGELGDKDTYMGKYLDTGEYNIVPYKDRFLHTLVLGVTGCGKTSQSLLPMVAKDIKCHELGVVCLDPKGDFAEKVYAMAKIEKRNDAVYFNPTLANCPYFNPMVGDIDSVSECLVTTFKKLENEQQTFFANMDEMLMRRCIKVTKRLKGNSATLNDISILMNDSNGDGKAMLNELGEMGFDDITKKENNEIISWFINDYYTELSGQRNATKTYEQCSGVRNQVAKLLANSLIKKILCPTIPIEEMEYGQYLDFDDVLARGGVLAMSSAQGELRELGTFIGFFLILSFESAVFRRPGDENTRRGVIFYVDEFQKYANDGYNDLLTMGRSYRVASVLATQTREGIKANSPGAEGHTLVETVSSNCRNKIIYPGCSFNDAEYYSKEFGQEKKIKEKKSYSKKRGLFNSIDVSSQSESTSSDEKMEPIFYPVDIQQRPFGEAVVQVVRHNTVQRPVAVKLDFIPRELNNQIEFFIEEEIRPQHVAFKSNLSEFDDDEPFVSPFNTGEYNLYAPVSDVDPLDECNNNGSEDFDGLV